MKIQNVTTSKRATDLLTREVKIAFSDEPDDTLTARVRVTGVSEELQRRYQSLDFAALDRLEDPDDPDNEVAVEARRVLASFLAELVAEWDLQDDDGPIPPTVEALERQGFLTLLVLVAALGEELKRLPLA